MSGERVLFTDRNFPASERSITRDVKAFNEILSKKFPNRVSMIKWKRPLYVFKKSKLKFMALHVLMSIKVSSLNARC